MEPQARSTQVNIAMKKELKILEEMEQYLTKKLSDEVKSKFLDFVNDLSVFNGETAQLKATVQMARVDKINNIRSRVIEQVGKDLVYT